MIFNEDSQGPCSYLRLSQKQERPKKTNNKQTRWWYDFVQNSMAVLTVRTTAKVLCGLEGSLPSVPGYLSDLISSHPPCVHSAGPAASLLVLKLRKHREGQWFSRWLSPLSPEALPQSYESRLSTSFFFWAYTLLPRYLLTLCRAHRKHKLTLSCIE